MAYNNKSPHSFVEQLFSFCEQIGVRASTVFAIPQLYIWFRFFSKKLFGNCIKSQPLGMSHSTFKQIFIEINLC